jgi:hypothetical protein
MTSRELLHRLLYLALVEMRTEAYEVRNKKVFHLADLLHTLPLQLERVAGGEGSYDEVLKSLHSRAGDKSLERWLENAIEAEQPSNSERGQQIAPTVGRE